MKEKPWQLLHEWMLIKKFGRNLEEASSQYSIQQTFTRLCRVPGTGLDPQETEVKNQSRVSGEEASKPTEAGSDWLGCWEEGSLQMPGPRKCPKPVRVGSGRTSDLRPGEEWWQ